MVWKIKFFRFAFLLLALSGCVAQNSGMPGMEYVPTRAGEYTIATWRRDMDNAAPVHIYIEGDGASFDRHGRPTDDPTPRGRTLRDLVMRDDAPNVVYIARPCQFIVDGCVPADWTYGRFSARVIDALGDVVRDAAAGREVVLVGYSGGAMASGLVLMRNPDMRVRRWITVAGVLNHADWTAYFGDSPLTTSLNMEKLPPVPQTHYIAARDTVVPAELSRRWTNDTAQVIPGTTHSNMSKLQILFDK